MSLNLTVSSVEINEPNTLVSSRQFRKPFPPINPCGSCKRWICALARRLGTFNDAVFCRRPPLLLLPDSKSGAKSIILNAPALTVLAGIQRVGTYVIAGQSPFLTNLPNLTRAREARADSRRRFSFLCFAGASRS